jgi:hypothetical protein
MITSLPNSESSKSPTTKPATSSAVGVLCILESWERFRNNRNDNCGQEPDSTKSLTFLKDLASGLQSSNIDFRSLTNEISIPPESLIELPKEIN